VAVEDATIIGCDTEVSLDGRIFGKPGDERQARAHLETLSGRAHEVLSGLAIVGPDRDQMRSGVASSSVTFRRLSSGDIDWYVGTGEWRERAGGYAIQGLGATLVERVEGEVTNVIGFPVGLLRQLAPDLL
jgi:septum formation protein